MVFVNECQQHGSERTMLNKTKLALAAALLAGFGTVASADEQFDVNIYRPVPQANAFEALAQAPAHIAPRREALAVRPFTREEKLLFERAVGAID
jgi:hypothetical protein